MWSQQHVHLHVLKRCEALSVSNTHTCFCQSSQIAASESQRIYMNSSHTHVKDALASH